MYAKRQCLQSYFYTFSEFKATCCSCTLHLFVCALLISFCNCAMLISSGHLFGVFTNYMFQLSPPPPLPQQLTEHGEFAQFQCC